MTNLFVGGLSYSITDQDLENMFKNYGQVSRAQVIIDRQTRQSKGFGFVEMPNDDEAQKAIQELNGKKIDDRLISVSVAKPREPRPFGFASGRSSNHSARRNR